MEPALRIGVTGHRVLGDAAAARSAVDLVLDRLLGDATAAVVISPLAEGADRPGGPSGPRSGRGGT